MLFDGRCRKYEEVNIIIVKNPNTLPLQEFKYNVSNKCEDT